MDTPQEGIINQLFGVKVGGEDNQLLERHLEGLPRLQTEEVDLGFQWYDPAVEQVDGAHLLAAKVVDEKHTAVGLHLKRCLVELSDRVEA